ncbi:uncharacterized protein LOC135463552 isoform X6 [Liolophura sinensis]|uniref:uncharacterized protein LOC135463552 isoform X6 n=1 Tax=Liolophura sinensis TaxID=3198878 RepID=UPI0031589427
MGVTLERVQNKFACIIGELCSEPLVLSQFAVWVDLRIAEYKTKGTISLDCSGESPNPGWMRGVKNHPPRTVDTGQGAHRRRGSFASSPSIHMSPAASPLANQMYSERLQSSDSPRMSHNSGQQQSFPSRLSPDIVVIKNEPSPEQQTSCAFSRKRTADSSELQSDFYSTAKSRRVGGSSTLSSSAQESSSNQSLMSIINTESDSISLEPVDSSEADIFKVTMDAQDDQNQGLSGSPSNSTFSPRRLAASATTSSGSPNNQSWMGSTGDAAQGSSSQTEIFPRTYTSDREANESASPSGTRSAFGKADVSPKPSISYNSVRKSTTSVRILMSWLHTKGYDMNLDLASIPVHELDDILAEFFASVKKLDGKEYLPNSYRSLRTGLIHFFQETGRDYMLSEMTSFPKSVTAFRKRFREISLSSSHSAGEPVENIQLAPPSEVSTPGISK